MNAGADATTYRSADREAWLRRWWNRRVNFPDPREKFVRTVRFDLLRSMRSMLRLMWMAMALLAGTLAVGLSGHALPSWASALLPVLAVPAMFTVNPAARSTSLSLLVSSLRPRWAEDWMEAGAPFARLWWLIASPVPNEVFARYAAVLSDDPDTSLDGGIDPRLVWYLHGVGMTPDLLGDHVALGMSALDAVAVRDAGLTVGDWALLADAGLTQVATPAQVAAYVTWVRESRASLHPEHFGTGEAGTARSLEACVPVMQAWDRAEGISRSLVTRITGGRDGAVMYQPSRVADGPVPITTAIVAGRRLGEWVACAGLLAPYFVAARIGLDEATAMVAAPGGAPRVEDLVFMAAWNTPTQS